MVLELFQHVYILDRSIMSIFYITMITIVVTYRLISLSGVY